MRSCSHTLQAHCYHPRAPIANLVPWKKIHLPLQLFRWRDIYCFVASADWSKGQPVLNLAQLNLARDSLDPGKTSGTIYLPAKYSASIWINTRHWQPHRHRQKSIFLFSLFTNTRISSIIKFFFLSYPKNNLATPSAPCWSNTETLGRRLSPRTNDPVT